jgi:hypothetical protein
MKNIAIVGNNKGVAIAMTITNGQYKYVKGTGSNNLTASLEVLKKVLEPIETNDNMECEARQIIIGSKSPLLGFVFGSYVDYIRTRKNASGKEFTKEEFDLIKEVVQLYATRCLNVRFTTDKYINKTDVETKKLINDTWTQLNTVIAEMETKAKETAQTSVTQANNIMSEMEKSIASLVEQMNQAVKAGDMKLAMDIKDMIAVAKEALNNPTTPITNTVEEETVEDPDMEVEIDC